MSELISCIITTYKRPISVLKRAIDSVANQTYKNIELIVVNDAPEEKELSNLIGELLETYQLNHKYIVHSHNSGACVARNTGIDAAKGIYVAFLDDDDEWLPEKLTEQYNTIKSNNFDLVYCSFIQISSGKKNKYVPVSYPVGQLSDFEKLLTFGNFIGSTSYPLIKKSVFDSVGKFNPMLKSSQDYEMWIRIAEKFKIGYVEKPLVNYYVSNESISKSVSNREQGFLYIIDEYNSFYKNNRRAYNRRLNGTAVSFLKQRAYAKFIYYWMKAVWCCPFSTSNFEVINRIIKKVR